MTTDAPGTRSETVVHPSALVDPDAELGQGVEVGPWTFVGPGVQVGDGTTLGPRVFIERDTVVGEDCRISCGAVLGSDAQDMKYKGERARLVVGDRTVVREYATLNRGTAASGQTTVGSDCLIMAYAHVAHDCTLGNHVILANSVAMGGHVVMEDWVTVGGLSGVHQFCRLGAHAFVGGASRITQDVPPYCRAVGNPPKLLGLNSVGLERRGFSPELRRALKRAYRTLFQSKRKLSEALVLAEEAAGGFPEVLHLLAFIRASRRGIID